ncbi:MAG TPA: hypothetical protein PLT65_04340, partial [Bacilli bacterium]|nr:hypothetical protein [Bacilli bacterium]
MGLNEIKQRIADKIKEKQLEYAEARAINEARNDFETTNKSLRNTRRHAQKYIDEDEKRQLEAYIRARQAQEDKSWVNPYGMLDNQEINISRPQPRIFETGFNPHKMNRGGETQILNTNNPFTNNKVKEVKIMGGKLMNGKKNKNKTFSRNKNKR